MRALGRNTGGLDSLPASHRELELHAVFWGELDLGRTRLWRVRAVFDAYGAAISLGLIPRPGTLRNRALLALQGYGLRLGGELQLRGEGTPVSCSARRCPATSSPAPSWTRAELGALLDRALELKAAPRSSRALAGRCVGLVFEKPSTRTRAVVRGRASSSSAATR